MAVDELCKKCVATMGDEIETWRKIKAILDNHPKRTYDDGVKMNFKGAPDFEEKIKMKIPINCEEMQYFPEEELSEPDEEDEEEKEEE